MNAVSASGRFPSAFRFNRNDRLNPTSVLCRRNRVPVSLPLEGEIKPLMPFSLPVAIAAVGAARVVVQAAQELSDATGFADMFHRGEEQTSIPKSAEAESQSDGLLSIGKIGRQLQEKLRQFHSHLRSQLRLSGVNTSLAFRVRSTATGVTVSDHPQAEQIEQIIAQSPSLTSDVRYITSMAQMARATQQSDAESRSPFAPREILSLHIDERQATIAAE